MFTFKGIGWRAIEYIFYSPHKRAKSVWALVLNSIYTCGSLHLTIVREDEYLDGFDWLTLMHICWICLESIVLDLNYFWGEVLVYLFIALLKDKQRFGLGEFDKSILYIFLFPAHGHICAYFSSAELFLLLIYFF